MRATLYLHRLSLLLRLIFENFHTMADSDIHNVDIHDLKKGKDILDTYGFQEIGVLGRGMSGEVLLVHRKVDPKQKFAVKKFSLSGSVQEIKMRTRLFLEEAVAMQAVMLHDLIVPCMAAVRCHDYAAIVMPYYPLGDMVHQIEQGTLRLWRVRMYMLQVAKAVEHLHRHRIAHCDIKPDNVFLTDKDQAVLGDLGLAVQVKDISGKISAWKLGGTPMFFSPERLAADKHTMIDPFKCDVYAIGVTYWLLISEGTTSADDGVYLELLKAAPFSCFPHTRRWVLERLLEPNPEMRPTASETVKLLQM